MGGALHIGMPLDPAQASWARAPVEFRIGMSVFAATETSSFASTSLRPGPGATPPVRLLEVKVPIAWAVQAGRFPYRSSSSFREPVHPAG